MKNRAFIPWAIASILLWCAAAGYFCLQNNRLKPAAMVKTIEQDLRQRQREAQSLLRNKTLWEHVFSNQLTEQDFNLLRAARFVVYAYDHNELLFWNTNTMPLVTAHIAPAPYLLRTDSNVYLAQRNAVAGDSSRHIDILIPVYRFYSVANEYIHSYFAASPHIPPGSQITTTPQPGSLSVRSLEQKTICYIRIDSGDIKPMLPNNILLLLTLAALLTSVMAIHLAAFYLSYFRPLLGCSLLLFLLLGARILTYYTGLPFHIGDLKLFSPQIFASSKFLPSFGDLMLNILLLYWAFYFILSQYERQPAKNYYQWPAVLRWGIFAVLSIALSAFCLYLLYLIQTLVVDSAISFDTNSFVATDRFTLLVLVTIAIICRLFFISIHFISLNINRAVPNTWPKYVAFLLLSLVSVFVIRPMIFSAQSWPSSPNETLLYLVAFQLGILYIYLKNNNKAIAIFNRYGLFTLIFWSVYCSIICAVFLKFYITQQERYVDRIAYAEKLSRQHDAEMELQFPAVAEKTAHSNMIRQGIGSKDTLSNQDIQKQFSLLFRELSPNRYSSRIFLYDADKQPVTPGKIPAFDTLEKYIGESIPTMSEGLFFHNQLNDNGYYLARIPIAGDNDQELPAGYLFAELRLKKNIAQSLYPKLLQNRNETNIRKMRNYSYAIYSNGKLKSQSGDYNFLLHIGKLPDNLPYWYYERDDVSELYYRGESGMVYVITYKDSFGIGVLTIFSLLFAIYLIISLLENWFIQVSSFQITRRKIRFAYNWSLSKRIKYFVLSFTIISFFVIGVSTVLFLNDRYKSSSARQIEQSMDNISEALSDHFLNFDTHITTAALQEALSDHDFVYAFSKIARQHNLDINIYDLKGHLVSSTQEPVYKEGVLSRIMLPEAFFQLSKKPHYRLFETEKIGTLSFTSIYSPIVNHDDQVIGYLNIPSFYSLQALGNQIRSLLITLVNIYTILLLLSSAITFLFVNSLSKSLRLVADSLKNVNLKKNERIYWPYKDEIGLLVSEYNKMVIAVEKNAMSLIKDERQSAWREMAKQVAHEIKNPLTPMKLNMQYLQQAIHNNHPDIIGLAKRVSESIIEQIDNLNYIASEFSNFAKMPEKNTEKIELISMLQRIVALYQNEANLNVVYSHPDHQVFIFSDKSQMLRIFTNIIQNAADAIPDDRQGMLQVILSVDNTAEHVIITISDNGSGIPEEIRTKIFEPYFTTKTSGTGLGLAMTKKIIELWGGEIWFESAHDTGTTFHIRLPFGY